MRGNIRARRDLSFRFSRQRSARKVDGDAAHRAHLMRLAMAGTLVLLLRCGSALVAPAVGRWPAAAGRGGGTRARLVMSRRHRRAHLQPPGSAPPAAAGPATGLEPATLAGVLEDHHYEQVRVRVRVRVRGRGRVRGSMPECLPATERSSSPEPQQQPRAQAARSSSSSPDRPEPCPVVRGAAVLL